MGLQREYKGEVRKKTNKNPLNKGMEDQREGKTHIGKVWKREINLLYLITRSSQRSQRVDRCQQTATFPITKKLVISNLLLF